MEAVCKFIHSHLYTIMAKYMYFHQTEDEKEHYVGGNISITTHIINKLKAINNIITINDINEECGIVIFNYNNGRTGSICEVKSNGVHYWLVNLYNYTG